MILEKYTKAMKVNIGRKPRKSIIAILKTNKVKKLKKMPGIIMFLNAKKQHMILSVNMEIKRLMPLAMIENPFQ